jgi:hypothetical protein
MINFKPDFLSPFIIAPMRKSVFAILSVFVFLTVSCSKTKEDSRLRRFVSMKLDNRIVLSENPTGTIYMPDPADPNPGNDYPRMEITAKSYNGDVITFTLAKAELPFTPGVYAATGKGNGMTVATNSTSPTTYSSIGSTTFYITITQIDNVAVEGSFSGMLKDVMGAGSDAAVRDGAFRALISKVQQ